MCHRSVTHLIVRVLYSARSSKEIFFFWWGRRRKCIIAPSALLRRVWDSTGFAIRPTAHQTIPPASYPLKPPLPVVPATSRHEKSRVGFDFWSKVANCSPAHKFWMLRCCTHLLSPSRNRIVFQLFVIRLVISPLKTPLVSSGAMT